MALCVRSFAAHPSAGSQIDHSSTMLPRPRDRDRSFLVGSRDRILAEKIISGVDVPGFASRLHGRLRCPGRGYARIQRGPARLPPSGGMRSHGQATRPAGRARRSGRGLHGLHDARRSGCRGHDRVLSGRRRPGPTSAGPSTAARMCRQREATSLLARWCSFPEQGSPAREMGVLAALGRETVRVRSLKVGVASTGIELVPPGHMPGSRPDL